MYCVSALPHAPFNTFVSGDGKDKCFVWQIRPNNDTFKCIKVCELTGHTESVEFIKFNFDGKYCVTGGMNNVLQVWNTSPDGMFTLKLKIENGPSEDINFVEWHPKGNAILCGGKDFMLYLFNGVTGDFLACFTGHEGEVLCSNFTPNGGKMIISSSKDKTIRVWSPIKQECQTVIKEKGK